MKLVLDRKYALPDYASLLLWVAITGLFLYERTYLIQKAGLPHFAECTVVRVGLLMLLCYVHLNVLVPFLDRKKSIYYGLLTASLIIVYLALQGLYDRYLFGFVIGDQHWAGVWPNLPYNLIATGWYLLLTYLVHARTTSIRRSANNPADEPGEPTLSDTTLLIKTGTQWVRLPLNAVRYAQGLKDYSILFTQTDKYIVKGSIGTVMNWLPTNQFIRVHKSYVVAKEHIKSVSTTQVTLEGQKIPVGRAYSSAISNYLAIN